MRVLVWCCCALLVTLEWWPETAAAVSKAKLCRQSCGAAVDACVTSGGKRKRCKRQTLKRCRKQGVETCTVTTSTVPSEGSTTTTTTLEGTTTTTLETINGCTTASAVNRTAPAADRTIEFANYSYDPPCIRIRAGQGVTFVANGDSFLSHPLFPGRIVDGIQMPDDTSPIPIIGDERTMLNVEFDNPGTFAYFCGQHGVSNHMYGVVYVDP